MPTAHLICGYIGSGKTTFARELEDDRRAVRFTLDEWVVQHYGTYPPPEKLAQVVQEVTPMIWQDVQLAMSIGRDVVLDLGFWKRADRDAARKLLSFYDVQMYLVLCDADTAWTRIAQRNAQNDGQSMMVSRALFEGLKAEVEPLGDDEDFVLVHKG